MTLIPIDRKQTILEDDTLEQIAKSHGITKRTLNTWLMSLGDEYQELRQLCIDNMLAEALEEIVWFQRTPCHYGGERIVACNPWKLM